MEKPESYIQQLVKYIKKNIEKGYTTDSLRWALINQGYTRVEVQKAIDIAPGFKTQGETVIKGILDGSIK